MIRKLLWSLAILSLLVGSAVGQKKFDTRLGSGLQRNDYPGWYLTSENSSNDTSWYIRDSSFTDTSLSYWTKPGWEVFSVIQTDYSMDSTDSNSMYVIMQYSMDQVDWATHDTTEIVGSATVTFTDWNADALAMRYFRFIVKPRPDSIFLTNVVSDSISAVSITARDTIYDVLQAHADSATWRVTMTGLTEPDDFWNGAYVSCASGDCSGEVSTVVRWGLGGADTLFFEAFSSACTTLASSDSLALLLPHPDSSFSMVKWAETDSSYADDFWNGASLILYHGDCATDTTLVLDYDSTNGAIIKFTKFAACTLAVDDSVTLRLPNIDSSFSIYGKIFTREP
jgi:hypothetical protein